MNHRGELFNGRARVGLKKFSFYFFKVLSNSFGFVGELDRKVHLKLANELRNDFRLERFEIAQCEQHADILFASQCRKCLVENPYHTRPLTLTAPPSSFILSEPAANSSVKSDPSTQTEFPWLTGLSAFSTIPDKAL